MAVGPGSWRARQQRSRSECSGSRCVRATDSRVSVHVLVSAAHDAWYVIHVCMYVCMYVVIIYNQEKRRGEVWLHSRTHKDIDTSDNRDRDRLDSQRHVLWWCKPRSQRNTWAVPPPLPRAATPEHIWLGRADHVTWVWLVNYLHLHSHVALQGTQMQASTERAFSKDAMLRGTASTEWVPTNKHC